MRSPKIDRPLDGLSVAEGKMGEGGTRDYDHLGFNPLHQTEVLKVIGVQSPWRLPCHPGQTIQMVLAFKTRQETSGGNLHEDKPPHF